MRLLDLVIPLWKALIILIDWLEGQRSGSLFYSVKLSQSLKVAKSTDLSKSDDFKVRIKVLYLSLICVTQYLTLSRVHLA